MLQQRSFVAGRQWAGGRAAAAPRWVALRAPAAAAPERAAATAAPPKQRLLYDGIALDMDGTLTSCVIDFIDMRRRTNIPVGDLFVAMESWEEPEAVKASMDVILEIEAKASEAISAKDGLLQLLQLLRDSEVKVALVTRNTSASVDAFFELIGSEWRPLFHDIRTREFRYVKPDPRLLLELVAGWGIHPGKLLMVGDSHEDVECGNAAGAATCLIAGGGNEVGAGDAAPPPGAVPTFAVTGLRQLTAKLQETAVAGGVGAEGSPSPSPSPGAAAVTAAALSSIDGLDPESVSLLGHSLRSLSSSSSSCDSFDEADAGLGLGLPLDPSAPGAPAPGLDFVSWLEAAGALRCASTSYPRMGAAGSGLAACPQGGEALVHVGCGNGSLTKMLASRGLRVWGTDAEPAAAAAAKRGLKVAAFAGAPLSPGSLQPVAALARAGVDAVLLHAGDDGQRAASLTPAALAELGTLLKRGGRLCAELQATPAEAEALRAALASAGFEQPPRLELLPAAGRLRLVAVWQG